MRILFTGASSFTGYWFVKELAAAGHDIVMTFRQPVEQYEGVRRQRVEMAMKLGRQVSSCWFGDEHFLQLIESKPRWDVLCHHAAEVTNYTSPDYDVTAAVGNNTRSLGRVLDALQARGCSRVVLTGSVFEQDEGAGSDGLRAFSPYGLAKGLTAQVFRYHTGVRGLGLGKFVIPNPFGPYEEARFTAYLIKSWFESRTPEVRSPAYVRDNIHVSLLAKVYRKFVAAVPASGFVRINPSGYAESQGAFACRFAFQMRRLLNMDCPLDLKQQVDFPEPRVRINTDIPDAAGLGWDEQKAWEELAEYYRTVHGRARSTAALHAKGA
jgi:UDP-glucose 4-epimerase